MQVRVYAYNSSVISIIVGRNPACQTTAAPARFGGRPQHHANHGGWGTSQWRPRGARPAPRRARRGIQCQIVNEACFITRPFHDSTRCHGSNTRRPRRRPGHEDHAVGIVDPRRQELGIAAGGISPGARSRGDRSVVHGHKSAPNRPSTSRSARVALRICGDRILLTSRSACRLKRRGSCPRSAPRDLDEWARMILMKSREIHRLDAAVVEWRGLMTMIGAWHATGVAMFSVIEKSSGRCGPPGPWMPEGWRAGSGLGHLA